MTPDAKALIGRNPIKFLDHRIVWDPVEGAFAVHGPLGDDEVYFHATTIDACVEAIAEALDDVDFLDAIEPPPLEPCNTCKATIGDRAMNDGACGCPEAGS